MGLGRILRSCAWVLFESIVACGPSQAAGITLASPGAAAFPIVDADSRPIIVNSFAQRVVTLAPSLTELMYATGAGEKLIGVSAYSDFPAAARRQPQVADAAGVSFEALLALKPDLVLAWKGGTRPADIARIESLGVRVFTIEIRTLDDIPRAARTIGKLVGQQKLADMPEQFAQTFESTLKKLKLAASNKSPLRVFFEIAQQPLMTVNGNHFITETMKLCGGVNVFSDVTQTVIEPSREELLKRGADVILRPASNRLDLARDAALYAGLEAYRSSRIYPLNADWILRPGPRLLLAAAEICTALDQVRASMATADR